MIKFKLWLEFEEVDPENWDKDNEFANIQVELANGKLYSLNVWTYKFFETAIKDDQKTGRNLKGLYQCPPDLFVKEMTRICIEQSIHDLLEHGNLEDLLNPSVLIQKEK